MVASAFVTDDMKRIIQSGLSQIPARSRFHEAIEEVLSWREAEMEYDQAVERIHRLWDENNSLHWCHAISNAMVVSVGLLWGYSNFEHSICRAVQACFDTDCNGATVGSILGVVHGMKGIPPKWTKPINYTLETGVRGYSRVKIVDLARQTMKVIEEINK